MSDTTNFDSPSYPNPESDAPRSSSSSPDRAPRERLQNFEQMKVWQEAHALTLRVFGATAGIPDGHQESLAAPMEQLAIAVPRNIAEGFKRRGSRNKAHFYNLAQSSLEALRYYFILARDLKTGISYDEFINSLDTVSRMLDSLVRSMARQTEGGRGARGGRGGRGRGREGGGRDGGGRGGRDNFGGGDRAYGGGSDSYDDDLDNDDDN